MRSMKGGICPNAVNIVASNPVKDLNSVVIELEMYVLLMCRWST